MILFVAFFDKGCVFLIKIFLGFTCSLQVPTLCAHSELVYTWLIGASKKEMDPAVSFTRENGTHYFIYYSYGQAPTTPYPFSLLFEVSHIPTSHPFFHLFAISFGAHWLRELDAKIGCEN